MIVVDASALVAILLREDEGSNLTRVIVEAGGAQLSPVGFWETSTRLRGLRAEAGVADLERLINELGIVIAPATGATARLASGAERTFGKRTPARLNLGDCFAYALARELDAPLLFKGDDFARTDVKPAIPA